MADSPVRQSAWNAVYSGQSKTVKVTFDQPTLPNRVVVVIAVATVPGSGTYTLTGPAGFTLVRERTANELKVAVWVREGAPETTSVTVSTSAGRSLQVEAIELQGVAQSGALDRVTIQAAARHSDRPDTGSSGTIAQADEIVIAAVANRYSSTAQLGFSGGLAQLAVRTTSTRDSDDRRSRLTVHAVVTSAITAFRFLARLTSPRDWIAVLLTFRGASTGPVRLSARQRNVALRTGTGVARLVVQGPIQARNPGPALVTAGGTAWLAPSDYQYLIGGRGGLLIGEGTDYRIASIDGLEGFGDIRVSDTDLPLSDGAARGVDLQAARLVSVKIATPGGTRADVEQRLDVLKRALVPQRDEDIEWIWRHPGQPLKMIRCRPVSLLRDMTFEQLVTGGQPFTVRAADPRIYSTTEYRVPIASTPPSATVPTTTAVVNLGSAAAHPYITVRNPVGADTVYRVALVNPGQDVIFDVRAVLPPGSTLVGDMYTRAVGGSTSTVTVDGRGKYGAWQHPRTPFRLGPGVNQLHLVTEPAGAPVETLLRYRDTWSG
jgi:hypothetical protein